MDKPQILTLNDAISVMKENHTKAAYIHSYLNITGETNDKSNWNLRICKNIH